MVVREEIKRGAVDASAVHPSGKSQRHPQLIFSPSKTMSKNSQRGTDGIGYQDTLRFVDWSQREAETRPSLCEFVRDCGNPIDEPDANNATKLYELSDFSDASLSERKWKRLDKYNSGISNRVWTNSPYTTYLLNQHHILALSSQLGLNRRQRRRVYNRFMQLELSNWGMSANLIAFCVCAVTVHNDDTNREYHYNQTKENKDRLFVQIADSLGLSENSIRKFYSKYRSHVDSGGPCSYDYLRYQKRSQNRRGI